MKILKLFLKINQNLLHYKKNVLKINLLNPMKEEVKLKNYS